MACAHSTLTPARDAWEKRGEREEEEEAEGAAHKAGRYVGSHALAYARALAGEGRGCPEGKGSLGGGKLPLAAPAAEEAGAPRPSSASTVGRPLPSASAAASAAAAAAAATCMEAK